IGVARPAFGIGDGPPHLAFALAIVSLAAAHHALVIEGVTKFPRVPSAAAVFGTATIPTVIAEPRRASRDALADPGPLRGSFTSVVAEQAPHLLARSAGCRHVANPAPIAVLPAKILSAAC